MSWTDRLENYLYGWARNHAPQISRDALDALIDNSTDICRDAIAGHSLVLVGSEANAERAEFLRGWAGLT